jgi:hypothetical protein
MKTFWPAFLPFFTSNYQELSVAPTNGWSPSVGSRPGYLLEPRNRIANLSSSGARDAMCNCMHNSNW